LPSSLAHYAMSFAVLYPVTGARRAGVLALLGLLPDVDALLGVHRSPLHSLVVWLVLLALGVWWRGSSLGRLVIMASLLSLIHIFADVFTGPAPLFWPFSYRAYSVAFDLFVSVRGSGGILSLNGVRFGVHAGVESFVAKPGELIKGPLVDATGVIVAMAVALFVAVGFVSARVKQGRW